ncbi:hypothetical protein J3R30DRAFT_3464432 [Lentinula aciculospora]|uniref:F-box domain-containing protein n=1 Tax=Lentinula aciculospora TaxID=153920 RepID=A0A9W9DQ54_9AGAR|nr:hypothetical protein J3R30DRAFT_3464432 [Lentinula aciculospora]
MGSLYHLPNELVTQIFLFCVFNDILSCQATCQFLYEIITTSSIIQYRIALEISGLEDNPRCKLSIPDRLQLLQRREAAWALFQPNFLQRIPVKNTAVVIYELSGGTYLLSGISRDSINHLRLPSASGNAVPSWDHIPVADELLDFGLAVTEHDLIGVLTTSSEDVVTTLQIRFLQLSTGLPHPLSGSPMRFTQHILTDNLGVGIEIVGNLAALVVRDVSFGHHNRDKVLVLDWKRGIVRAELYVESRRYQSAIFLTPEILLVTNAHERCLEIWRIPPDSGEPASFVICRTPELSLGLPVIHPGFIVSEFACRSAPNPILSTCDTSRPFHSSPAESIMVFHLTISPIDPRVPIPFVFFAHRRAFLDALTKIERNHESQIMPIPWSGWGPPKTRWLHARSIPTEWITTTSGQRYAYVSTHAPAMAQPVVILDFNQNHVRKVIANMKNKVSPYHGVFPDDMITTDVEALSRRVWTDQSRDKHEKMKVFAEDVGGYLPYIAVKSAQAYQFHGVLMDDERIIGIKRNHVLSGVESIEVIHMG